MDNNILKILKSIPAIFIILMLQGCERSTQFIDDPGIPPTAPTGLRVYSATDGEVVIIWNPNQEPDVKGYNIYRKSELTDFIIIAFTNENFFFDDSLDYDTTYYYKISAVSIWNRESDLSNEVSAKPVNRNNPGKPFGLSINARNWEEEISVYLNWLKNEESDVEGYNIYKSSSAGFTADSTNFIGYTVKANFSDTNSLNFYEPYYYKIKAKDKGGLLSIESDEVNDLIFEIPEVIFPPDDSVVEFFEEFIIKTINAPATYRIGLQTNKFFGEIWNTTIQSTIINDTLLIPFDPPSLLLNKTYYWRIAAYSGSPDPNSVSKIFSITFRE